MKTILKRILLISLGLTLVCGDAIVSAAPAPAAQKNTAQDKKRQEAQKAKEKKQKEAQRAKEKKQKEAQKERAAKQKEQARRKAQQEKERQQQEAQRAKDYAERQREAERRQAAIEEANARREAQEEAQKQAYFREQELLNDPTPRKEVISLINIGAKVGYSALMDKQTDNWSDITNPGRLDSDYPYNSLTGGAGAGLSATYELQYGAFRFETGLDFTFLNSRSDYAFMLTGREDLNYHSVYSYITSDLRETRNVGYIGLPIMFGAQFSRYYFMLGAKVGYGIFGNYRQKGQYEIIVNDNELFEQYGLGMVSVPQEQVAPKLNFRQPSVSLCAEVGVDLDEWLQAAPAKQKKRVKAGERLPFGRENIHYKVSAFAEYGVLNTNNPSGQLPLAFADNTSYLPTQSNTMLNLAGSRLNNLFVGVKFAVQFEIPGKTPRPTPPPASYADVTVVDAATGENIPLATLAINNTQRNRTAMKTRILKQGTHRQKLPVATFEAVVAAKDYYADTVSFAISTAGDNVPLKIQLRHKPVFHLQVTNAETGKPMSAHALISKRTTSLMRYELTTDSISGNAEIILADSITYSLSIEQIGFEAYHADIAALDQHMQVALRPIKKGDVFVVKNLFFATNQTRILRESEEALNELYQYLNNNSEVQILIIGHTDNVGTDEANMKLSDGRANAVRSSLIQRGIAPERIAAEGRGESRPIDTNDTEEGRQNNRRVEIEIR